MLLNSEKKVTSILKLTFRFAFIVAISQLLISCCASQKSLFSKRSTCSHKTTETKTTLLPKKVSGIQSKSNVQGKSKKVGNGRVVVGKPYKIKGKWYYPQNDPNYKRIGEASWYGSDFHGRLTANGEIYDMNLLTAAHPTMPLPSYARVTNLKNGSSIIVRVNDRGPFLKDRIIDLSKQAAKVLGYVDAGVTNVKVEYIAEAPVGYYDGSYLMASYTPGNDVSSLLALAIVPKRKEDVMPGIFYTGSKKERSVKDSIEGKQFDETFSIKLPEIGPVLVEKPKSFDQIASINKLGKKIKESWLRNF
ncbi:septal ring lytic transglycosylase RlpA family protein [Bartonella doshiae]|uniref:septal ring lytic transglycosylase RlpA family protein n=1 Tax=Bartonella doshiae TaxID=33044 RepID=UPI00094548B2|nr:septal ring lytic transglycosylase RlpA family protein [Bartonella doshiae]